MPRRPPGPSTLLEVADVKFFFAMAAQDSQSTIVSDFGTAASSPAPREAPESPPAECRWGDGAVVAGWLCCLAVFLAGVWERTVLHMRHKSRADPLYYAGIVMIAVGTLVLGAGPATKTRQASRAGDAIKARHTGNHTPKSGLNSTQGDADSAGQTRFVKRSPRHVGLPGVFIIMHLGCL